MADSDFTLTESRLLWEFAHRAHATAAELARDLDLDPGYLSRLLRAFKDKKLVCSERSAADGRNLHLSIAPAGERAFAALDRSTETRIQALLATLADAEQHALLRAMADIERLLGARRHGEAAWLLRPLHSGDLGWVIARHGALYAREYGWDTRFEALVARIAADFVERFDAARAIYAKAGYVLVRSEPHTSFGTTLIGETWELSLD